MTTDNTQRDTSDQEQPLIGQVLHSDFAQLVLTAREVRAEIHHVILTAMTFHVKQPGVVIIAYPVEDGAPPL